MKFWHNVGDLLYFQSSHLIVYISFGRYSPLSLEVVEKLKKCKFLAPIFGRDDPDFSTADCKRDILSTVWQSLVEFRLLISICKTWCIAQCSIYGQCVNTVVQFYFWRRLWTKVHDNFETMYETPCSLQHTCPTMYRISLRTSGR